MKKILGKIGVLRCLGICFDIVSIILFIVSIFVTKTNPNMALKVVGIALFVIGGFILALTSEEHRTFKSLLVFILAMIIMTWLFPYGYFQGADFYDMGLKRLGLADLGYAFYYSISNLEVIDKIIFLFAVAGFYGVLAKTDGYQKMVNNLAKKFSNKVILFSVITSVLLFVMTSVITETFVVIAFVPFFISILLKMNMDKLSAFAVTFGSIVVGLLGAPYGTESLVGFNEFANQALTVGLKYRFIIAAVALVLYEFFLVMRIKKVFKDTKKSDKNSVIEDDPFKVEETKSHKSAIPVAVILVITAIILILGYINWQGAFGIKWFNDLHTKIIGIKVGKDVTIFSYILGNSAKAFGDFTYLLTVTAVLFIMTGLVALLSKMKFNEVIANFYEGNKKMFKPALFLIGLNVLYGIANMMPVVPSIANWVFTLFKGFSPYVNTAVAFITSAFHTDLRFTSYLVSGYLTSTYAANMELVHIIWTSMYGLVQVFLPTSAVLLVGLSFMKVDYKTWFKYIWLFVVGIFVILLVLFTVLAHV